MATPKEARRLWTLTCRTSVESGTVVLLLEGRLSQGTTGELRAAADAAAGDQPVNLIIDLSGVDYLSSSAIGVFEGLSPTKFSRVAFRSPSPAARLSLELGGLSNRIM